MSLLSIESEAQAQEVVRWAASEDASISIQGYNSKAGFGHAMRARHQITTRALAGVLSYQPEELVMTVLPGTRLSTVEAALADNQQYLPFEPPRLGRLYAAGSDASMAGVFMANLAGPARFKAGAARDYLLGIRAVNGRGEPYQSGGKVIKNVSGYDMSKLLTGSWGTLSIVTELTFKVLPAPPCCKTLVIKDQSSRTAQQLFQLILGSPYEASGLAYVPSSRAGLDGRCVYVRLQGSALSTQSRAAAIAKAIPPHHAYAIVSDEAGIAIWQAVRDITPFTEARHYPVVLKLSIPPASMVEVADVIEQLGGCSWFADAAGAWLWVGVCAALAEEKIAAIRRAVSQHHGSAILYRAAEEVKRKAGLYAMTDPALHAINRRLKQAFDPQGLFNPGRLGTDDAN